MNNEWDICLVYWTASASNNEKLAGTVIDHVSFIVFDSSFLK